jgi:hypothetical protein
LTGTAKDAIERVRVLEAKTFERPDGQIIGVDQRNRRVWINLGREDSLPTQTSFAVYPADVTAPTEEDIKGSIEVIEVTGDNMAVARILDDSPSDPIMANDKIHTPIWKPGERRRFALAGVFDINDDGRDDIDIVKNLITMNGGQIDAIATRDGIQGEVSLNTRYLVLGSPPKAEGRPDIAPSFNDIKEQARALDIETLSIEKLLDMIGYRPQAVIAQFGEGSGIGPARYRARNRAEGERRTSDGNVSGLFQERRPTRTNPGGAY